MKETRRWALAVMLTLCAVVTTTAQTGDGDDVWRQVELDEVHYQQARNYCQRLYGYYRYTDDGVMYAKGHEYKLYRIYEGIFELDIRYSKDEDDGAEVMVGRNLVHPDRNGKLMDFYELKPYTFLEKARKEPKTYTLEPSGDTTRVYTRLGLAGVVVRDTLQRELHMTYDALAPDTSLSINLLLVKARLSNVRADATYWYDEASEDYVPQGQLRRAVFDGHVDMTIMGSREVFDEHTELYIDSVAYYTREQYRAEKKVTVQQRRQRCGYTVADIDRLKQKLDVPPLTDEQRRRIEEQRDWEEQYELWRENRDKD